MTTYPYDHIQVNQRKITLADIISSSAVPADLFEQTTFAFIRRWMTGENNFEIHTSGSTGAPKKIIITRQQMEASAKLTAAALGLRAGYRALICLDTRYIAGQMMLVRSFVTGMQIVVQTPSANPFKTLDVQVDFAALVPSQVYEVVQSPQEHVFNQVKTIIIGGGAISASLREALQRYACTFYATYGMTETLSHIALQRLNGQEPDDFFRTLPGIQIEHDDRECLVIHAPYLEGAINTNDLVHIKNSNEFKWLGRFDNIINTGGVKVIPEKVEEEIGKAFICLNIKRNLFIYPVPDDKFGEKIMLFIESEEIDEETQKNLARLLRTSLPPYEIPKEVIVLNRFDMTETGKINRFRSVQNSNKSIQKFTLKN
jgi:O-succinylbenzoic acid--CoA ligase